MEAPAKSFVFYPLFNGPPDHANPSGHDATGAFQPGMHAYRSFYEGMGRQVVTFGFDNTAPEAGRRRSIIDAMQRGAGSVRYDAVVYFGHGWANGLSTAKIRNDHIPAFAGAIQAYAGPSVKLVFYACYAAAPGGFAYQLARALSVWANAGLAVFGHPIEGHSFRNPIVRRFPSSHGESGEQVCPEGRRDDWRAAMRNPQRNLWLRFPFMTTAEIDAEL